MAGLGTFNASVFGVLSSTGAVDTIRPTVTYGFPDGKTISPGARVTVSVNDETGILHSVTLNISWPLAKFTLPAECVYDGQSFYPFYAGSTVVATATGFDFVIGRIQPWPTTPKFETTAVDGGGNRAI